MVRLELRSCQDSESDVTVTCSTVLSQLIYLCLPAFKVVNVLPLASVDVSYPAPSGKFATLCACNQVAYDLMVRSL